MYGAVEFGGTKTICAVLDGDGVIQRKQRAPTSSTPEETMRGVREFFTENRVESLGIATFGPVCVDPDDGLYGTVLRSPKTGWQMYSITEGLKRLDVPIALDTDVNCSALGEYHYGKPSGHGTLMYITVGTGIGVGICMDGRPLHGMMHPEGGHINVTRYPGDDFRGVCPFHEDCCESLASGPAMARRWGCEAIGIPDDHVAWRMESWYVAQLVNACMCFLSPETVVLGGGVMDHPGLIDRVRDDVDRLNGEFFSSGQRDLRAEVRGQSLGGDQALLGCLKLAKSL